MPSTPSATTLVSGISLSPCGSSLHAYFSFPLVSFRSVSSITSCTSCLSFLEPPESFFRRDPQSMICTTQKRKDAANPSPSSPFSSFQISAAFLLHLFQSDTSINRAFSAQIAELLLISFLPVSSFPQISDRSTFPLLSTRPFNISCFSLNNFTSCIVSRHLLSNSTRPCKCAFHLARLAIHTSSSPCLKISKVCLPFSFIACWATCRMEIPTFPICLAVLAIQ